MGSGSRDRRTDGALAEAHPESIENSKYNHLLHWEMLEEDQDFINELDEEEDDRDDEEDEANDDEIEGTSEEDDDDDDDDDGDDDERSGGKVSMETAIEIINDSMAKFTNKWDLATHMRRMGKRKAQWEDPVRVWEKAEAEGSRPRLIEEYRSIVETNESMLDNMAKAICLNLGTKKMMKKACKNLGGLVDNLEEAKWYLSIYEVSPENSSQDEDDDDEEQPQSLEQEEEVPTRPYSEVIDLGSSSPSPSLNEGMEEMASPLPAKPSAASSATAIFNAQNFRVPLGSKPEMSSIRTISGWNMANLIEDKDRKRIVMKVFVDMGRAGQNMVRSRFRAVKKPNLLEEIRRCIDAEHRKEARIQGVLPSDMPKILVVKRFFFCWWFADDFMQKTPTEEQLDELVTELPHCEDLAIFYDWVYYLIHKNLSIRAFHKRHAPSDAEVIVLSD